MKTYYTLAGSLMAAMLMVQAAHGTMITTYYGDDDGFGIGATSGSLDPTVSNASGDDPFTDVRLISADPFFVAPAFTPTGGFDPFVVDGPILSATLTMRTGAFANVNPLDGPQALLLDGVAVPSAFFDLFDANTTGDGDGGDLIETESFALDPSFFGLLADGSVSLAGTHISEGSFTGSFQVDFIRLDIETASAPIPEPATLSLLGLGVAGLAVRARRKRVQL